MDVENDIALASIADEACAVLDAFEAATGCFVCFRPLSERWLLPDGRALLPDRFAVHRSDFCATVKARSDEGRSDAMCNRWDVADLPSTFTSDRGKIVGPLVRTCHAGVDEILLPLWSMGSLVAVLFVGQFVATGATVSGAGIRTLDPQARRNLVNLTRPLSEYLLGVLDRLDEHRHAARPGRRGQIDGYLKECLASGPTLLGLATRLGLSPNRTSHVVRELTGRSFRQLLEDHRLTVASDYLTSTDATVAWVAHQVGFSDVAYFSRYFKRKTGLTPTVFRSRHDRVVRA